MKNSLNSKFDQADLISEFEDRTMEIIMSEKQGEKRTLNRVQETCGTPSDGPI